MSTAGGSLVGGSLSSVARGSVFSLRTESDVLSLLKYIHQTPIDPDIKNELRDGIFAYQQSRSQEVFTSLYTLAQEAGITLESEESAVGHSKPEALPSIPTPSRPSTLGSSRPAPRFGSVAPKVMPTSPLPKTIPVTDTSHEVAEPAQGIPATVVNAQTQEVQEPLEEMPKPQAVAPREVKETQQSEVVYVTKVDPTVRIQEIKRTVNEKVGNPVNLISSYPEEGREYMTALLDAMKKAASGGSGINAAMERLEKAFTTIEGLDVSAESLEASSAKVESTPTTVLVQPLEEMSAAPKVDAEDTNEVPPSVVHLADEDQKREETPKSQPQTVHVESIAPTRMASVKETLHLHTDTVPAQAVTPKPEAPKAPVAPMQEQGIPSVAKEKQVQDLLRLDRLKGAQSVKSEVTNQISSMDPLATPEVNAGLEQLLSEWSLFKSSGIFGTGPSGNEHPLYKKIHPLTMAAVIAGRFEGATPQIKQSITDYMNGWRYEEGIVHEHGETFEHYLRRVVKHIIQKRSQR